MGGSAGNRVGRPVVREPSRTPGKASERPESRQAGDLKLISSVRTVSVRRMQILLLSATSCHELRPRVLAVPIYREWYVREMSCQRGSTLTLRDELDRPTLGRTSVYLSPCLGRSARRGGWLMSEKRLSPHVSSTENTKAGDLKLISAGRSVCSEEVGGWLMSEND